MAQELGGSHWRDELICRQIEQVSTARAHTLLEIRRHMTEEQTALLHQHRPRPPH